LTQTVGITAAIGTNSISYQASTGRWSQVSAFRTFACLEEINSAGTRRRPLINHLVESHCHGLTPAFRSLGGSDERAAAARVLRPRKAAPRGLIAVMKA
jgi:hypothetical protein